jgi:UDP-glucose 4-epimerase
MTESNSATLLVTGGTGYIGSHTVVEILQTEGFCGFTKIVIVDNLSNSSAVCLERMQQITGKVNDMVVFEEMDICNEAALDDVFSRHAPVKSVVHFAGLKAVGESVREPMKYYENNVGGSVSLVKVMLRHNCKNIVFSSSSTLYGEQEDCTEDKPI